MMPSRWCQNVDLAARSCSDAAAILFFRSIVFCSVVLVPACVQMRAGAPPPQVRRVYVGSLGDKPNAREIQKALIEQIRKTKEFEAADSAAQADAVLDGDADIYIRGYFSLYARAGTAPANGKPVYGGYVSVELKSPSGDTIWSYLSTLHGPSMNPFSEVAKDVIKHLVTGVPSHAENAR